MSRRPAQHPAVVPTREFAAVNVQRPRKRSHLQTCPVQGFRTDVRHACVHCSTDFENTGQRKPSTAYLSMADHSS
jgi:hypothetical protein